MADKTINDLTAVTTVNSGDLFELENTGNNSRKITGSNLAKGLLALSLDGAKVRKSASLTAQDITAGATVTFNSEDWDTGSYHDNVTNSDRLTVTNAGYYEVAAQLNLGNTLSGSWVMVTLARFNSSAVQQEVLAMEMTEISAAATVRINLRSTGNFASGDFARMTATTESDTSTDITTDTWFEIRRVG